MPTPHSRRALLTLTIALSGLNACGGGGGDGTGPGLAEAIAIALSGASASAVQGGQHNLTVTVTKLNGYTGSVTVTVEGLPSGVAHSVGAMTSSGTTSAGTVTFTIGAAAAAGLHNITVRASGTGVQSVTATFALTITVQQAGTYTLLTGNDVTVQQGGTGGSEVLLSRANFSAPVDLTSENVPSGMTVTFTPSTIPGNSTTSVINVTVGSGVAAQQYTITVRGKATGLTDRTATFKVTVTALQSFTIAPTGSGVTVNQGASVQNVININRGGGFAGSVALTAENLPNGLTASFNPPSTTGNTSTLTLTASAGLTATSYTILIRGTAQGMTSQTASLLVTVNQVGGSGNVTLNFNGCGNSPFWVAYQDGSGPWTRVTGTNNNFQFTINSATGGFAYVTAPLLSSVRNLTVRYMTRAQMSAATITICPAAVIGTKLINGTTAGITAAQFAFISLGNAYTLAGASPSNFILIPVLDGSHDLVGYRTGGLPSASDRIIIRRDQNIPNGGNLALMDFSGSEAVAAQPAAITVIGALQNETLNSAMAYLTGSACTTASLYSTPPFTINHTAFGVPAASQRASDYHQLTLSLVTSVGSRTVIETFHTMAARTVTFSPNLSNVAVTILPGNYKRLQATFGMSTDYNGFVTLSYQQQTGVPRPVSIMASAQYLATTNVTIGLPNFTGVTGWDDSWGPLTTAASHWSVTATGGNLATTFCAENIRFVSSNISGAN